MRSEVTLPDITSAGSSEVGGRPEAAQRDGAVAPGTYLSPRLAVARLEFVDGPVDDLKLLSVLRVVRSCRGTITRGGIYVPRRVQPLLRDRAVLLPLAAIGQASEHGRLLGIAVAFPADLHRRDRRLALQAIGRIRQLRVSGKGAWNLVPQPAVTAERDLRAGTWTAHPTGATRWSTVTPIVFGRRPRTKVRVEFDRVLATMVAESCTRIGLPEPREVILHKESAHLGVPSARAFPSMRGTDNTESLHRHAVIEFERPVCGPIVLGTGMYHGYGFCRPIVESDEADVARMEVTEGSVCEESGTEWELEEEATGSSDTAPFWPDVFLPAHAGACEASRQRPSDARTDAVTGLSPHLAIATIEHVDGPVDWLRLTYSVGIVDRWRKAIAKNKRAPDHVQRLLSGRERDGSPLAGPHITLLPLASIGHPRAYGALLGMAVGFPADLGQEDRRAALDAIGCTLDLRLGRHGRWKLVPLSAPSAEWNLRAETWTAWPAGATEWATVTPIALDWRSNSDEQSDRGRDVCAMIAASCKRMGLPEPHEVKTGETSLHLGAPPARTFRRPRRWDGSESALMHAVLRFERPVCGPVILGGGRHRGYGFCRPSMEVG